MLASIITNLLLLLLIVVIVYDTVWFRIPNLVVGAIALLFVIEAVRAMDGLVILDHLGAGLVAFALGVLAYSFRVFGAGDAKLLGATGLWAGFAHLSGHLLMLALLGGVMAVVLLAIRKGLFFAAVAWPSYLVRLPRVLKDGEAVPYGVPIAISLMLIRAGHDPISLAVSGALSRIW